MTQPKENQISLAIPNKGRLAEPSLRLLGQAGLKIVSGSDRQLVATTWGGKVRVLFVRAGDIAEFVEDGVVDAGITGHDLVAESGKDVQELLDLGFGQCRLVLAVHERVKARTIGDLPEEVTVATSFPRLTKQHLETNGRFARVVPVSGATEAAPHIGVADVIVDLTASGSTLRTNDLVEVDEILTSTARLIANHDALADDAKRPILNDLLFAVKTVVDAQPKRYLMMDAPVDKLDEIRRLVPGIAGPTIMDVAGNPDMKAVHVVVDESDVHETMKKLVELGARGILIVPVDRMVS